MSGQMGGGSGYGSGNGMAAWLELRERRIRALEAENQELRRQLDELRRGAGIAVLIDGHPIPLAGAELSGFAGATAPGASFSPSSAVPGDTRPAAATSPRPVQRPHVSQPSATPATSRASAPAPYGSGYAFEQPWPASHAPAPLPSPSLPSMPTTQAAISVAPSPTRRPAARDSSWLTDERPAVANVAPTTGRRAPSAANTPADEDAWLRSGATWPQPTRVQTPAAPALPPLPAAPARHPHHPVSVARSAQGEPAPTERNIFADSFIL